MLCVICECKVSATQRLLNVTWICLFVCENACTVMKADFFLLWVPM
jgi:hypothetical protein